MIVSKVQVILVVIIVAMAPQIVEGLFERANKEVELKTGATLKVQSLPYRRNSQTRFAFVGEVGAQLALVCNIDFSEPCRHHNRRRNRRRRTGRCQRGGYSEDYFYIGYNLDLEIRGAVRYHGRKTIRKTSLPTTGRPALVIATSATENGEYGSYKCVVTSREIRKLPPPSNVVTAAITSGTDTRGKSLK